MKSARFLLAAAVVASPATAFGQASLVPGVDTATATLELRAVQPSICQLSSVPAASSLANVSIANRTTGETQLAVALVDPQTGAASPSVARLTFDMTCTGPHRVTVRTGGGLRNTTGVAPASGDFRSDVAYSVQTFWAGRSANGEAAGAQSSNAVLAQSAGESGQLVVDINIPGGGAPLIAGEYRDTIFVEVGAEP